MGCFLSLISTQGLKASRGSPSSEVDLEHPRTTPSTSQGYSRGIFSQGTPTVLLHLLRPVDRKHSIWVHRHQNTADIGLLIDSGLSDKVIVAAYGPLFMLLSKESLTSETLAWLLASCYHQALYSPRGPML